MLVSKGKDEDESVHAFVSRRLGSEVRPNRDLMTYTTTVNDVIVSCASLSDVSIVI